MKTIILVFACFLVANTIYAQEQKVPEEVISFDVLKWHYSYYPNSQENEWTTLVRNEQQLFRVRFMFQDQKYQVEYDDRGKLLKEALSLEDELPASLVNQLEQYEKYKINSFSKIKDIGQDRVVYRLDVKVKSEGDKTIWYDENLIQMPNTDFTQSLSDLY